MAPTAPITDANPTIAGMEARVAKSAPLHNHLPQEMFFRRGLAVAVTGFSAAS